MAAAVAATQRLKPRPAKGTQRLGRPAAGKPAKPPGKTGTQRIGGGGGGTTPVQKQAKKVLHLDLVCNLVMISVLH